LNIEKVKSGDPISRQEGIRLDRSDANKNIKTTDM
jgi:hypothetical protein